MKISTINRFFNVAFGALAMVAVALFSAYLAMRIAIHGREVEVPTLAGLSLPDAAKRASSLGLRLNIENRFYSPNAPAGTVLSQSPAPKSVVRRDWTVRVTQSLGPQQVSIPNLVGQSERPATIAIRRLGLELGTIAHIPSPGPTGIVLAQTPNPSDTPAASPRISLLLSAAEPAPQSRTTSVAAPSADPADSSAIVPVAASDTANTGIAMPSLVGLTLSAAISRTSVVGLHIVAVEDLPAPAPQVATPTPATPTQAAAPPKPDTVAPAAPRTVVAQRPPAGQRVQSGDPVKITLGR